MRQVAVALKIDLNTVQRAYAELEREGALTKIRGVGTFITDAPPPPKNVRKALQDFAFRIAGEARGQGIALDELAQALAKLADRGA
jgi:GntR family transcriptional regulator